MGNNLGYYTAYSNDTVPNIGSSYKTPQKVNLINSINNSYFEINENNNLVCKTAGIWNINIIFQLVFISNNKCNKNNSAIIDGFITINDELLMSSDGSSSVSLLTPKNTLSLNEIIVLNENDEIKVWISSTNTCAGICASYFNDGSNDQFNNPTNNTGQLTHSVNVTLTSINLENPIVF
jgi:hypothetical protein